MLTEDNMHAKIIAHIVAIVGLTCFNYNLV